MMRGASGLGLVLCACHRTDPACLVEPEGSFGPAGTELVWFEEVAQGLDVPWGLVFLPDGSMLVTERAGRIRLVRDGFVEPEPVATLEVSEAEGGGLLGVVLHPAFDTTRAFFVYSTQLPPSGDPSNRVERYRLDEGGTVAFRETILVEGIPSGAGHDGGSLHVGDDALLYIATGDAGDPDLAQDEGSLAGKILRLAPDAKPATVEVFARGLRNPQGIAALEDGRLLVTDRGPSGEVKGWTGYDELDLVSLGDNLGWPEVHACTVKKDYEAPLLTWAQSLGAGAVTRVSDSELDAWNDDFVVTALAGEHLQHVELDIADGGEVTVARHEVYEEGAPPTGFGRLRAAVVGPDGFLYLTTNNCDDTGTCPGDGDKILRVRP